MSGVQENMLYFQSYDGKKNNFIFIIFQEKLRYGGHQCITHYKEKEISRIQTFWRSLK